MLQYPEFRGVKHNATTTHIPELVVPLKYVSAGLDDSHKRQNEDGQELDHAAHLPHPWGQVDVAWGGAQVKHLPGVPGLEGGDSQDKKAEG